jgi:hypothetical protein
MLPLFDMIMKAQAANGDAMAAMAKQFGLSAEQTQSAVEALLPAFSQGLKRNAANPLDLGNFMSALASGDHAKYFEDITKAMSPQGMADGNGILGHLFGSKELSRAVAQQASAATGIGTEILKQMLPVLASAIMGGLFKQTTGQLQAAGMGNNPFAEVIEQMMRQQQGGGYAPRQPESQAAPDPFDNPFGKVLKDMFGGGMGQGQPQQRQQNPMGDNPLGRIFEEMMKGGFGGGMQQPQGRRMPEPVEMPRANPSGRARNPYDDLFGDMFETGRKTRDQYQQSMESIFDQFLRGMDRPR